MRPIERRRSMAALVERQGDLSLAEACRCYSISPATARRDFDAVAALGLAAKTWGGLRRHAPAAAYPMGEMAPFRVRSAQAADAKQRIAQAACGLVEDGDVVMIDGGSTTFCMAPFLASRPVHILTNSIAMAHALDELRPDQRGAHVQVTGGALAPGSGILVGPEVVHSLSRFNAKWAFLSVGGFDEEGATNTNQLVAESERAMIRSAQKSVILADATKAGRRDMVKVCSWAEAALLVTDAPFDAPVETLVAASGEHQGP